MAKSKKHFKGQCPVCGEGKLTYNTDIRMIGFIVKIAWSCLKCFASGIEISHAKFVKHDKIKKCTLEELNRLRKIFLNIK